MTITVTNIVAGPFVSTGSSQTASFDFMALSNDEVEVYYGDDETIIPTSGYLVDREVDLSGQPLEGGDITLEAGAVPAGQSFYIRAKPTPEQSQVWNNSGSRLSSLNVALDRLTLLFLTLSRLIAGKASTPSGSLPGRFFSWDAEGKPVAVSGTGADSALRTDLAASLGGLLLGWVQAGANAVVRTILSKLRERVSFEDYGAVGNGIADDAAAIRNAIAAKPGQTIRGKGVYLCGSSLGQLPPNTRLQIDGRRSAKILRGYSASDYLLTMMDGSELHGVCMDGNGFDGGLVEIPVANGNQSIHDSRLINAKGGTPLRIRCTGATDAEVGGSRLDIRNLETWRSDSTPGSGRFAIVHDDPGVPAAGHPISIHHLETSGFEAIDLGACNDLYLGGSTPGAVKWSVNTRGFHGFGCRFTAPPGEASYTVKGTNEFTNCSFARPVIADVGALALFSSDCVFNNGITDNTGTTGTCSYFDYLPKPFTPNWKSGATAITLGADGEQQGSAKRQGTFMELSSRLRVAGAGGVVPAGIITCELSYPPDANSPVCSMFTGHVLTASGNYYPVVGFVSGSDPNKLNLILGTGLLTDTSVSTALPYVVQVSGRYPV